MALGGSLSAADRYRRNEAGAREWIYKDKVVCRPCTPNEIPRYVAIMDCLAPLIFSEPTLTGPLRKLWAGARNQCFL